MSCSTPGLPVHHHLLEFTQTHFIESVMPSSHLILCCPLFLLPSIRPSIIVFSSESTLDMRWLKYWSFSFSIIPSKDHPGLMSFRMDRLALCSPWDSQESYPTPEFKTINFSTISFLHTPTLTSIHDPSNVQLLAPLWNVSPLVSSFHRNSPGKNIEVSCHAFLQGIFITQE